MKIYFVRNSAPAIWRALIAVGILLTGGKFAALRAQSVTNYAADASSLRDAINLANTNPGPHVIILATNAVYSCSNVDNFWYGPNALPPIASDITIEGNGAVMVRSATSRLRFFYVGADSNTLASLNYNSPGAGKLTLRNLILTNGLALGGNGGGGGGGMGGAIFNQGILILYSVTFSGNTAQGGNGASNGGGAAAYYNGLGGGGMGEDGTEYRGGGFGGSVTPSGSHGASSGSGGGVGGGGGGFGVTDNATNSHGGGFSNGLGGGNLGGNGSGGGGETSSSTNGGAGGGFGGGAPPRPWILYHPPGEAGEAGVLEGAVVVVFPTVLLEKVAGVVASAVAVVRWETTVMASLEVVAALAVEVAVLSNSRVPRVLAVLVVVMGVSVRGPVMVAVPVWGEPFSITMGGYW
ncbi:hypothetical protein [Pedosphaera parvula]|nr:hypothetical protein [Pedosphaera parvula]